MNMQLINVVIDPSEDQMNLIEDHLIFNEEIKIAANERAWIHSCVQKQYRGAKVLNADLDLSCLKWNVSIEF